MDETIRDVLSTYKRVYIVDGKETSPEKLCERLGFTTKQLLSRIKDLSGGQRRRLSLLLTILDEPNVLILDEPGNDLDTDMLAIVEDLLDGWPGTLILVTHDRFLMERVTDSQFALIDGHLRHVPGGVDQYLKLVNEASAAVSETPASRTQECAASPSQASSGLSNAERQRLRREVSSLERKMEARRAELEKLQTGMADVDPTDYAALEVQQKKIDEKQDELDDLETSWLETSEQLGE